MLAATKLLQDIDVIELACSVRTGKILAKFFFCKFIDQAAGEVHKLAKQELDQYLPSTDRTSKFNKVFIIMALFQVY